MLERKTTYHDKRSGEYYTFTDRAYRVEPPVPQVPPEAAAIAVLLLVAIIREVHAQQTRTPSIFYSLF